MGKIRVKTLGDETLEEQQKKESKKRKEAKKTVKAPGLKGGQRVVAVGPSEEELAAVIASEAKQSESKEIATSARDGGTPPNDKAKKKVQKKVVARDRSKRYKTAKLLVENKVYSLTEALELLPKLKLSKFDETVELHINTIEPGISGSLTLPHGTGKKVRVVIADDEVLKQIEQGKINFDVLLAEPSMMPKLAKVAKILGPKGLMPNPKNGTVTTKPEQEMKKYEGGHTSFKTESKLPVIHLTVGKLSFGNEKLSENVKTVISAVQPTRIRTVTLKSTMSPGIKLDATSV